MSACVVHSSKTQEVTCGVNSSLRHFLNILEELGLGCSRVAQQQQVDVSTQPVFTTGMLLLAPKQSHGYTPLDVGMAVD